MAEGNVDQPVTPSLPVLRSDGALLHFLKELPAWCVIGIFVGAFLVVWQFSHDDFIPRIIDSLIGALLTAIVSNRQKTPPKINADAVQTNSMDNAQVSAESVSLTGNEDPGQKP